MAKSTVVVYVDDPDWDDDEPRPVHQWAAPAEPLPCCGRSRFAVSTDDGMSLIPREVTCRG